MLSGAVAMPFTRASQALSRFTVLDLTRVRSGPTCVRQLADWGANVIKIETPKRLEKGEGPGGPRQGADFQNLHRNKRSMTLDLKSSQGHAAFLRMVAKADVVVENFRPDVKHRLGIDYDELRKVNKSVILASISGFGQDGPYRDRPGVDQIAQGMGGLMSITGLPGQGPVRVGIPVADLCAGLVCALGIMVALLERETSGEGQWITTSLLQAQIFMLDFQTGALRSKNRDACNAAIEAKTVGKTSAEWIDIFNEAGVPAGPINSIDQVFADEQVKHLGIAQNATRPDGKEQTFVGQPITLSRTPSKIVATPPELGQHTDEVLKEFGFADQEIAALHTANAV